MTSAVLENLLTRDGASDRWQVRGKSPARAAGDDQSVIDQLRALADPDYRAPAEPSDIADASESR
jgi:hypothetical protein